jgi:crotonobetainyl-CoA:carnitine CoA-transferase CaiB-like acyl-CoA transferase
VSDLPVSFGRINGGITHAPPTTGEHSREILTALGLEAGEIAALFAAGVVA